MKSNKRPSKTVLKKSLIEAVIDPRVPGPNLAITIEEGNSTYFEIKAIELIREARLHLTEPNLSPEKKREYYQDKLTKALTLIALAKVTQ